MSLGKLRELHAERRHRKIEQLFCVLPRKLVGNSHSGRQTAPKIVDAPALAGRLHRLLRRTKDRGPSEPVGEARTLQPTVARQNVVCQLRSWLHHMLKRYYQVLIHYRAVE